MGVIKVTALVSVLAESQMHTVLASMAGYTQTPF
ncbi:hypothetical protein VST7929_02608 [Vibrio stylophorae]|uniref:Uncharacterized protein n=1 Tax=Vibrio stylophorae TaxID=659351 RepID=A0ABM8ZWD9_9VIBR|nr:hypothetical protein VST7929_02608 [Vibrio stylophorae]